MYASDIREVRRRRHKLEGRNAAKERAGLEVAIIDDEKDPTTPWIDALHEYVNSPKFLQKIQGLVNEVETLITNDEKVTRARGMGLIATQHLALKAILAFALKTRKELYASYYARKLDLLRKHYKGVSLADELPKDSDCTD